jgi:2-polyprenyl-3-methyl-5-hydroxy-6-metoxy-1,4-benzoquinol methylase
MGRFASTVALYEKFRPPYPPEFFREVATRLKLTKQHSLIDLGTGPALLALGFAPYVGRIVGVDPEPAMLAAACESAKRAGRELTLIEGKAEELDQHVGRFDLVTIGRALHWMDRAKLPALFARLVGPGGAIAVCASSSARSQNPWFETYEAARRAWSDERLLRDSHRGERMDQRLVAALEGSEFHVTERIRIETTHEVSVLDLTQRMLTFSPSSPDAVGDGVEEMLRDVETRLLPFARDGVITEVLVSVADVARRKD